MEGGRDAAKTERDGWCDLGETSDMVPSRGATRTRADGGGRGTKYTRAHQAGQLLLSASTS